MKPTSLRAGDRLKRPAAINADRIFVFLRRVRPQFNRPAINVLFCQDYVGLNGPMDDGRVEVSDHDLSRNWERAA